MKTILYKTVGWTLLAFYLISAYKNNIDENWLELFICIFSIAIVDSIFGLELYEKGSKIKQWFLTK